MGKTAVLFPGQGSQYVGMGLDFYRQYKKATEYFQTADQLLGYPLSSIIFEGPENQLRLTENTQPAILLTSLAIWSVLQEEIRISVDYVAGHSLGEYSALSAAGSIEFSDALQLVRKRGQFMEEAVPNGEGTMAAIMGMERDQLEGICTEITKNNHPVQMANINAPGQIVISGTRQGVELASASAKENGARRVIPLPVSGPFHSILMEPAKENLEPHVYATEFNQAKIPVVMNVNAMPEIEPAAIKKNLLNQVISPVLWTDTIEWMINQGVDTFIEVGPGNVLSGLVKKINRNVQIFNVDSVASYEAFKEQFKGGNR